jgi:hypothetical protein
LVGTRIPHCKINAEILTEKSMPGCLGTINKMVNKTIFKHIWQKKIIYSSSVSSGKLLKA